MPPPKEAVASHRFRRHLGFLPQAFEGSAGRLEASFQGEPAAESLPKRCSRFASREEECLGWDDNPAAATEATRVARVRRS